MCVLGPTTRVAPLVKTITSLHHLHPLVEVDLPLFVDDFHPEMDLVLDREAFIFALTHLPCLSFDDLSSTVYEILKDYLFLMIQLIVVLISYLRYVGTSFVVTVFQ
jgi:hypothetical protein